MSLANDFSLYKEEIELILAQNHVEIDLYSIIASVVRGRNQSSDISLRDVSARRRAKSANEFYGNAGFPDFLILTREKSNQAKILGAIEAKYVGADLKKHIDQLEGHLKSFKKVIHTNGLIWRYYDVAKYKKNSEWEWEVNLGETTNDREISWNGNKEWTELLGCLDKALSEMK